MDTKKQVVAILPCVFLAVTVFPNVYLISLPDVIEHEQSHPASFFGHKPPIHAHVHNSEVEAPASRSRGIAQLSLLTSTELVRSNGIIRLRKGFRRYSPANYGFTGRNEFALFSQLDAPPWRAIIQPALTDECDDSLKRGS